ncbi:MAG TPA: CDP-alcohol phosphatidyltransferase family protein [Acidobacteriota bacterium]|nr:CDP-alcohol phosphatidyltransferase family protein [Acidobacteriota bacterium]
MKSLTTANDPVGATAPTKTSARRAGGDLVLGLLPLLAVTFGMRAALGLPIDYVMAPLTLYALQCAAVVSAVPLDAPGHGLGAANRATLGRSTLVMPVASLVLYPMALGGSAAWWIILVGGVALLLDGFDGWLARRTSSCTEFGGRFDMELDAFFIMGLSMLVWLSDKVGPWVLLIGAFRYLFVAAGWLWPSLRGELRPSQRRKAICTTQGVALLVCLLPVVPATLAAVSAASALLLLTYSFAVDIRQLALTSQR